MRRADIKRQTSETNIALSLGLDDSGPVAIETGHGFFDHMLHAFARHSRFSLDIKAQGDSTGPHHLVEDVAIVLGEALNKAAGDKKGIERFGDIHLPMDETLAQVSIDFSGRGFLVFEAPNNVPDNETGLGLPLVKDFFYALCINGKFNLNIKITGSNPHHLIEAAFKATAISLRRALAITGSQIPSTKGSLS